MMAWRKIAVLGFGASLIVGCTITTSDGGVDSGIYEGTGGSSNQGGAASTGGNGNGGASSVIACDPSAEPSSNLCGICLQTADNAPASPGMCTEYLACAAVSGCVPIVGEMTNCMAQHSDSNGNLLPDAETTCKGIVTQITANTAAGIAAATFWNQIATSLECSDVCWAV